MSRHCHQYKKNKFSSRKNKLNEQFFIVVFLGGSSLQKILILRSCQQRELLRGEAPRGKTVKSFIKRVTPDFFCTTNKLKQINIICEYTRKEIYNSKKLIYLYIRTTSFNFLEKIVHCNLILKFQSFFLQVQNFSKPFLPADYFCSRPTARLTLKY